MWPAGRCGEQLTTMPYPASRSLQSDSTAFVNMEYN
jgi:hypothetical protein